MKLALVPVFEWSLKLFLENCEGYGVGSGKTKGTMKFSRFLFFFLLSPFFFQTIWNFRWVGNLRTMPHCSYFTRGIPPRLFPIMSRASTGSDSPPWHNDCRDLDINVWSSSICSPILHKSAGGLSYGLIAIGPKYWTFKRIVVSMGFISQYFDNIMLFNTF